MKEVSNLIKNKRIEKGYSVTDLAKKINVSYSSLYNLETGKTKKPKSLILYRICLILNIDYNYILNLLGYEILIPNRELLYHNQNVLNTLVQRAKL